MAYDLRGRSKIIHIFIELEEVVEIGTLIDSIKSYGISYIAEI